jgi:hypothetical protein
VVLGKGSCRGDRVEKLRNEVTNMPTAREEKYKRKKSSHGGRAAETRSLDNLLGTNTNVGK